MVFVKLRNSSNVSCMFHCYPNKTKPRKLNRNSLMIHSSARRSCA